MREVISTELKFWKLALRESYYLGLITEDDLMRMHSGDYYDSLNELMSTDSVLIEHVFGIMNDIELFVRLMQEEAAILSTGIIPDDKRVFKKMWLSYLLDCHDSKYISDEQFNIYYGSIKFDGIEWSAYELEVAHDIVEVIRLMLVHQNLKLMDYIKNPSFDLLMYINELEYI
jgi:hypothetical protein